MIRTPISWRSPEATSRQNCLGLWRGGPGGLPGRLVLSRTIQAAVADTWMVVEAIPERLDLKRKVFGDLDRLTPEDAILASNSSSYPTSQFIDAVSRPRRVANTHYYRPPEVNVVEVMSCGKRCASFSVARSTTISGAA